MRLFKTPAARHALLFGALCSFSYVGVYLMRNMLGAATPLMVQAGAAPREFLAVMTSVYTVVYAAGSFVNGLIGERVKVRYMASGGLLFAGLCMLALPYLVPSVGALAVYGAVGFFLSMIYNPLIKLIAENTEEPYTERCSIGFTVSSFLGAPLAGLLATFLVWQGIFRVTGGILLAMGTICFVSFLAMERRGIIRYGRFASKKGGRLRIGALLEHNYIRFLIVAILTGVVRTAVVFWVPTYLVEHLKLDQQSSGLAFSAISLALSSSTLAAIVIYERVFGSRPRRTYFSFFCVAAAGFLTAALVRQPVVNAVALTAALYASGAAAGLLYCQYCTSLKDTGMVSSATGLITGVSYVASALASSAFGFASGAAGWQPLVFVWMGMMLAGAAVMLPVFDYRKKAK